MTNDNFRDSLDYWFSDTDIENKKYLEILMRKQGFFNAKEPERRDIQTQQLLDSAWDYLKGTEQKENIGISKTEYLDYYFLKVKGFRKQQLRDKKTGRIKGWL